MPHLGGIKRWCCLTSVCLTSVLYIQSAGGVCGRPAGWCILADRARLGRPGSRLPLRASVASLGGGISWLPPTYSLFSTVLRFLPHCGGGHHLPLASTKLYCLVTEAHFFAKRSRELTKFQIGNMLILKEVWKCAFNSLTGIFQCSCTAKPMLRLSKV